MRRAFALLVFAGVPVAIVACGLDIAGQGSGDDAGASSSQGDAKSTTSSTSGGGGSSSGDGGKIGVLDASEPDGEVPIVPVDASLPGDGGCGPTAITDNFAVSTIDPKWQQYGGVTQNSQNGNGYGRLIQPDVENKAAGLFWVPQAKATSFTATFSYYARTDNKSNIGDGITLTWITAKDANPIGTGAVTGQGLGIWPGVAGYAFALDAFQNSANNDPEAPSFNILKIDPKAPAGPGFYDWHLATSGPWGGVYDGWLQATVKLANGHFTADVGGASIFFDSHVDTTLPILAIGFTAATGGNTIAFFIDSVSIQLTDATCN